MAILENIFPETFLHDLASWEKCKYRLISVKKTVFVWVLPIFGSSKFPFCLGKRLIYFTNYNLIWIFWQKLIIFTILEKWPAYRLAFSRTLSGPWANIVCYGLHGRALWTLIVRLKITWVDLHIPTIILVYENTFWTLCGTLNGLQKGQNMVLNGTFSQPYSQ